MSRDPRVLSTDWLVARSVDSGASVHDAWMCGHCKRRVGEFHTATCPVIEDMWRRADAERSRRFVSARVIDVGARTPPYEPIWTRAAHVVALAMLVNLIVAAIGVGLFVWARPWLSGLLK